MKNVKKFKTRYQAPSAKLCYNNSPSFNWTLSFRKEVYDELSASRDMSIYDKENLMDEEYDATELGRLADERIQSFQADSSQVRPAHFVSTQLLIVAHCLNVKFDWRNMFKS